MKTTAARAGMSAPEAMNAAMELAKGNLIMHRTGRTAEGAETPVATTRIPAATGPALIHPTMMTTAGPVAIPVPGTSSAAGPEIA
jgi:hypothetical protein